MRSLARLPFAPLPLAALLVAAHAPVLAQEAPAPARPASEAAGDTAPSIAPSPAPVPARSQSLGQVTVTGESIGLRQSRANVKITAADLEHYPTGVSAD